jgi:hypothetical protein
MKIYNHFKHHALTVSVEMNNGAKKIVARVPANSSRNIDHTELFPGVKNVYVRLNISIQVGDKFVPISDVDALPQQPEVHIGQVTTRIISHRWIPSVANALSNQGLKFVRINNMTKQPITFGDNPADTFTVEPMCTVLYPGRERYGVPFGTIFADTNGLYEPFKLVRPITDMYYGMVTSIPQIPYGGDQASFDERPSYSYFEDY